MRKKSKWPTITEVVRESIHDLSGVVDTTNTLRNFNALQYQPSKEYGPGKIKKLRINRLHMSQAVFANVCNIKLATLQKWERGFCKPTPPVMRLFQLIENGGIELLKKSA